LRDGTYSRKKWKLTSNDIYVAYNLQYDPVALVSEDYLSQYTDDGVLGTIASSKSYNEYQFVDSGRRFYIPDISYCAKFMDGSTNATTSWGFDCFNTNVVKTFPGNTFLERIPGAGQIKPLLTTFNHITYRMADGKKNPIYNPQTLFDLGYSWSDTTMIQDINAQQPTGPLQLSRPAVLAFNGGPFMLYDNATFTFHALSGDEFEAWQLYKIANASPPVSSFNASPPSPAAPALSIWATDGTKKYIVDGGRKIDVTAAASDLPAVTWRTTGRGRPQPVAYCGIWGLHMGPPKPVVCILSRMGKNVPYPTGITS
jgi:hypothetical protein